MMQSMSGVFLTLFFSPFFALSHSLQCDDATQRMEGERCCNKCQPGERVKERCSASGPTRCVKCGPGFYSNKYNVERSCHQCKDCSMIHLEYEIHCAATHNAKCRCERGYRCKDESCLYCEKITSPETDKSTTTIELSVDTERPVTSGNRYKEEVSCVPEREADPGKEGPASSTWSTQCVIIVCCCALLIFVILVSRNKNVLRWNWWTTKGFRVKEEAPAPHQCSEEEGKMPVQEVCEKLQREENIFY